VDGEETVACFTPAPTHRHSRYVYGGLLASLIDCHGTGTASAAAYREAGRRWQRAALPLRDRFAASGLPAADPMGVPLEIRGWVQEVKAARWW